jgi:hypothetical protein
MIDRYRSPFMTHMNQIENQIGTKSIFETPTTRDCCFPGGLINLNSGDFDSNRPFNSVPIWYSVWDSFWYSIWFSICIDVVKQTLKLTEESPSLRREYLEYLEEARDKYQLEVLPASSRNRQSPQIDEISFPPSTHYAVQRVKRKGR